MIQVTKDDINTRSYWSEQYLAEMESGRKRVDPTRLAIARRWAEVRKSELNDRQLEILDVGCGLGEMIEGMKGIGRVFGVDISEAAISHCRRQVIADGELASNAPIRFQTGHADSMQFSAGSFEFVFCGETIEHLKDPGGAVKEMARVCRPQAFLMITTPYRGRNRSPEHIWEFEPKDLCTMADLVGELVFLDCNALPGNTWTSMIAVIRVAKGEVLS